MSEGAILLGKAGFVLFALGLFIGIAIPKMRNPRMGLSAHLTAVQTGPALITIALFWPYLTVPQAWAPMLVGALILSSYLLVAGILLAAFVGASRSLPIAGHGHSASAVEETVVAVLVKGSAVVMTIAAIAICGFALA